MIFSALLISCAYMREELSMVVMSKQKKVSTMISKRSFLLRILFSFVFLTLVYLMLTNVGSMYYITQENCNPDIVEGYDLSMFINENTEGNVDFYHPRNTGVFVYKISAFSVNIYCHVTLFVGFVHRDKNDEEIFCVFKYKDSTAISVKAQVTRLPITPIALKYKYHPALIKCPEIEGKDVPSKVSLFSPKQEQNQIKVQWIDVVDRRNHTKPAKGGFAICLNTIYNQASEWSLAEWMETQRLMGVNKVILYGYKNVSHSVLELIKYYQKIGFLHVQSWNLVWPLIHDIHDTPLSSQFDLEGVPDSSSLFSSNNDCLYRFGNQYRYLIHIDTDEYIVATNTNKIKTYQEIVKGKEKFNTLCFLHARFCVPDYLYRVKSSELQTVKNQYRESHPYFFFPWRRTVTQRKNIFKPSEVCAFGIHEPLEWCFQKSQLKLDVREAQLNHYRYRGGGNKVCPVLDKSMSPFKESLEERVKAVVQQATKNPKEKY